MEIFFSKTLGLSVNSWVGGFWGQKIGGVDLIWVSV